MQAEIRESWLMDMSQILDEKMVCNSAAQAEAAIKKHEAISAEILARVRHYFGLNSYYSIFFEILARVRWGTVSDVSMVCN